MSLTTDTFVTHQAVQERLDFERYRVQGVLETHAVHTDAIVGVVSDYLNALHYFRPEHIFEPIERNETPAIAIGITEELEQVLGSQRRDRTPLPHSGEVYGVFVDYIKDEQADMLREQLKTSAIPRAVTLTLTHFILGGVNIQADT